jgi:glycosyltransferase involved in cell wall biosynthesis
VVPVLDGAATIRDMLEALLNQSSYPGEVEYLVVDNGSVDRTREIVHEYGLTLLREPVRGPGAARNRGLRHARGEVVVHLDADTVPSRRWLVELLRPFEDPRVMLAGGRTLCFLPQTPAERFVARSGLYDPEGHLRRPVFPFLPSLNLAVSREAALAVGGWSTSLRTAEDVDFCHRLRRRFPELRMVYRDRAVLFHRCRRTDEGLKRQARSYGEGAARMYRRYPEEVAWDAEKSVRLAATVIRRVFRPLLLRAGSAPAEDVEFARYHSKWTRWYWSGFFREFLFGPRSRSAPCRSR